MLSQAMSQAVSHEFKHLVGKLHVCRTFGVFNYVECGSCFQRNIEVNDYYTGGTGSGSSADSVCVADDIECLENVHDRLGMEAIKSLHQQLDDDDNGNIDLTESDDFLREELKYDSGYEKRHKTFHYNDDTQISVKELWEAWLRSEVHNWTVEQTTDWLSQSVQLPQYVELFQKHKVSGETLPRLAVHNMHYVSTVLGIRDPIHKQKIALKAMDVVLFGPPRETGTRWKDYFLVTLLLSAIIGCWYAFQQNKNAKRHLRRMAKDMEGLQRAENALTEMQKELELARLEQENVATEKLDLERRLKEAPSLSSSSSDLELQQLKQEIEMLRAELSRAEVELVDHCWTPPPALQSWLQLTYELESKHTLKKRVMAEKQLQLAREACEKLKRKRSSLVGAFVSTHGKSIDEVDRSIVEARNALSEVTNELQERLQRWKQIELLLGFSIVNNNGLAYLENVLYNRNGSAKSSRNRMSGSQDELDDESVQGAHDNMGRLYREDSSGSDDGEVVTFIVGSDPPSLRLTNVLTPSTVSSPATPASSLTSLAAQNSSHPMSATIIESFTFNSLNRAQSSDMESLESTSSPIVSSTTTTHGDTQPEDTYSTDSSSFDGEFKKRRRKLHFPFVKSNPF
ncbi:Stromal interaction molecule like [Pseudolycoriella hygida]|uniref:Stromal interaction molecule like n=1 Tax=Pseudolycoriella hygida TaxID=35572 RepID=A0A9Q0RYS1_9DIPT|nr:Stromal interaction molecule like [Pseudolycoriella hygida]